MAPTTSTTSKRAQKQPADPSNNPSDSQQEPRRNPARGAAPRAPLPTGDRVEQPNASNTEGIPGDGIPPPAANQEGLGQDPPQQVRDPAPATNVPPVAFPPEMMTAFAAFWAQWQQNQGVPPPPPPVETSDSSEHNSRTHRSEPSHGTDKDKGKKATPPLFTLDQVEELVERKLRRNDPDITPVAATRATHPFTDRLFSVELPKKVIMNPIPSYTGVGDPSRHVNQFTSSLLGRGASNDHFALMFPSTLSLNASSWFYNLPRGSIDSWADLKQKFEDAHVGERTLLKNKRVLKTIKMTGSLADYHSRFFRAIQDLDKKMDDDKLIEAFSEGLGENAPELLGSLILHPIHTTEQLVVRVKRYIDLETTMSSRRQTVAQDTKSHQTAKATSLTQNTRQNPQGREATQRPPRTFTALICPISTILRECRDLLAVPKPRTGPMGKDLHRYCEYHSVKGHGTDDCFDLKKAIETAIQRGQLGRYVDNSPTYRHRSRTPPRGDGRKATGRGKSPRRDRSPRRSRSPRRGRSTSRKPSPPRGDAEKRVIHTIAGGFAAGGETVAAREVYLTQPAAKPRDRKATSGPILSFSDKDIEGLTTPHDDALVVTVEIAGCLVERVLVDGGSSADILFLEAFNKLGLKRKDISSYDAPLVGFAGHPTYALGAIKLPMVLGRGRDTLKLTATFIVVDAPATFNVIMGRTTINPHMIVPSTAHQVMRFPSQSGRIGEVWGDQPSSRRCYFNTLKRENLRTILTLETATKIDHLDTHPSTELDL